MRLAVLSLLGLCGCAAGMPPNPRADGGPDAHVVQPDAGRDAGSIDEDAGRDAEVASDAGEDAAVAADGGGDGGRDAGGPTDAGRDAGGALDGGTCGAISAGHTLTFDGVDDAAEYPSSQVLTPGAPLQPWEAFGLTWDADYLYVTMVSQAFEDQYKPVHVYLEARASLGAAAPSTGKTYNSLTPQLPFTPTHVIAVRRTSDSGSGGPYNGVYTPASSWGDRATPLVTGVDTWVASDNHTIAVRVPWSALGCPSELRLSAHVINGAPGHEWKDLVPTTATPWTGTGGGYYEIDLSGDPAIAGWALP